MNILTLTLPLPLPLTLTLTLTLTLALTRRRRGAARATSASSSPASSSGGCARTHPCDCSTRPLSGFPLAKTTTVASTTGTPCSTVALRRQR